MGRAASGKASQLTGKQHTHSMDANAQLQFMAKAVGGSFDGTQHIQGLRSA
jgi:hypothetical protein